jgi:hypothetical protein
MSIISIDKKVDELIDYIRNSNDLRINQLLATKVAFQLSKLSLGLRMIKRTMKLYDNQELIEDRLLDPTQFDQLSVRELLVLSSINSKRMDNYYAKVDKILSSLNLSEVEGTLLTLAESQRIETISSETIEDSNKLRNLSLELLDEFSKMKDNPMDIIHHKDDNEPIDKSDPSTILDNKLDNLGEVAIDENGDITINE